MKVKSTNLFLREYYSKMVEVSISDLVDNEQLPILVRLTRSCTLKNVEVFKEGQQMIILNKRIVQLVFGVDWHGNNFRINTEKGNEVLVETVETYCPDNEEDILKFSNEVTYVQLKKKFGFGAHVCDIGERFIYSSQSEHVDKDNEKSISFIREKDTEIVHLPVKVLLDNTIFVFVKVHERLNLQTLLRSFTPQKVRFVNGVADKNLPVGVCTLNALWNYDTILSGTLIPNGLVRYELYSMDRRIMVENCNQHLIPEFVQNFGDYQSQVYREKMKEIEFQMYFNIFAGRVYGYVDIENPSPGTDQNLIFTNASYPSPEKPSMRLIPINPESDSLEMAAFSRERPTSLNSDKKPSSLFTSLRKMGKKIKGKKNSPTLSFREIIKEIDGNNSKGASDENRSSSQTSEDYTVVKVLSAQSSVDEVFTPVRETDQPNKLIAAENPLYGCPSPELVRAENSSIKSKPLSEEDLRRKGTVIPFSPVSPFSSPNSENDFLSKSFPSSLYETPFHEHSIIGVRKVNINDIKKRRSIPDLLSSIEHRSRHSFENRPVNGGSMDSGIDDSPNEPQVKYELRAEESNERSNEIIQNISKSKTQKPIPPKKPPRFQKIISGDASDNTMQIRERSQSEPLIIERTPTEASRPKSLEIENHVYEDLIYAKVRFPTVYSDFDQKREVESLNEIKALTFEEVLKLLGELGLGRPEVTETFSSNMLKGQALYKLEEKTLYEDLKLNMFEARKLYKYIHGWRPNKHDLHEQILKDVDVESWSVQNVRTELTSINLRPFATFCVEHDVDGSFLLDFLKKDLVDSLAAPYGIRMNSVEFERFHGYITKEVTYDDDEKKRILSFVSKR